MTRKTNVTTWLFILTILIGSHIGLIRSFQSRRRRPHLAPILGAGAAGALTLDSRQRPLGNNNLLLTRTVGLHALPSNQQQQPQLESESSVSDSSSDINSIDGIEDSKEAPTSSMQEAVRGPLLILLVSQFLLFIGVGAVIPSIPLYGQELGFSSAANGIVLSAPAVALLLCSRLSGTWSDQSRKRSMMGGMAVIALADLGTSLAQDMPALIVARLGLGAGRCVSEAGERGMLADLANQYVPELRGRILGAQQTVMALGIAIGAPIGGVIVETYGPRASFLCVTVAALVTVVLYGFLPETAVVAKPSSLEDKSSQSGTQAKNPTSTSRQSDKRKVAEVSWKELLKDKKWQGLALCQCGSSFGFAAKLASIPILASAVLPGGAIGAGALISAAGLSGGLVGAPLGGYLTDRIGPKATGVASGMASATALIAIPFSLNYLFSTQSTTLIETDLMTSATSPIPWAFVLAVLLWSSAAAAQGPALTAWAQTLAPRGSEATGMALPKAAGDCSYIVAPFVLGLIADQSGPALRGIECAAAGTLTGLGVLALVLLGGIEEKKT